MRNTYIAPSAPVFTDDEISKEEWKTVPSCPRYQASSLGRIRSMYGAGQWGIKRPRKEPKILSLHVNRMHGYLSVGLGSKRGWVHGFVCEAFHGPCPDGHECAHADGVRINCRAKNLSWKTPSQNQKDKELHGTFLCGERDPKHILKEHQVREIKSSHLTQKALGIKFGVSASIIQNIVDGHNWKHVR